LSVLTDNLLFDFRALFQKNDVADYEATAFSIFYNNALFLVIVVLLSFYLLKGFSTTAYPFKILIFFNYCVNLLRQLSVVETLDLYSQTVIHVDQQKW